MNCQGRCISRCRVLVKYSAQVPDAYVAKEADIQRQDCTILLALKPIQKNSTLCMENIEAASQVMLCMLSETHNGLWVSDVMHPCVCVCVCVCVKPKNRWMLSISDVTKPQEKTEIEPIFNLDVISIHIQNEYRSHNPSVSWELTLILPMMWKLQSTRDLLVWTDILHIPIWIHQRWVTSEIHDFW